MERPKSKWFTGCVVVIIAIAGAIVLVGYPFRSHTALKISFIILTNDATVGSQAVFGVTNESPDSLNFNLVALQTKSHGVWVNVPLAAKKNISLAAHATDTFTADLPNNHAAWRVWAIWCYEKSDLFVSVRGNVEANLYFNWQNLTRGRAPHYYNSMLGASYIALSPEFTN